jgi:hypothetical protein
MESSTSTVSKKKDTGRAMIDGTVEGHRARYIITRLEAVPRSTVSSWKEQLRRIGNTKNMNGRNR